MHVSLFSFISFYFILFLKWFVVTYSSSDALLRFLSPTLANPPVASTSAAQPSSDAAASSGLYVAPIDPVDWPSLLTDKVRTELVNRGPFQIENSFTFPKTKDGQRCLHDYFNRLLINGEKVRRSWLKDDSLHCFCCKLFLKESTNWIGED